MINLLRLIIINISYVFIQISHISPNLSNEMNIHEDTIAEKGKLDNHFRKFIIFNVMYNVLNIFHFYYYYDKDISASDMILFFIIFTSFLLRMWCYNTLGKYFTFVIGVKKDHKLITDGPYHYLVHPSYTSQILLILTHLILIKAFLLLPMVIFYLVKILPNRIKCEENILEEKFGADYKIYLNKRYRLIPLVY